MKHPGRLKVFTRTLFFVVFFSFPCKSILKAESLNEVLINTKSLETDPPRGYFPYSLKISDETFSALIEPITDEPIPGLEPNQLYALQNLMNIDGNLTITANHPGLTSLRFFKNLHTVKYLVIRNTSLLYLDLVSLDHIRYGVLIEHNAYLCVNQSKEFWKRISNKESVVTVTNNKPEDECAACDVECEEDWGCWGPGPDQCRRCKHLTDVDDRTCVSVCDSQTQYTEGKHCQLCHGECLGGCVSSHPYHCKGCKNKRIGDRCVPECQENQFSWNGVCTQCHEECVYGCSGPGEHEGPDGCDPCEKAVIEVTTYNRSLDYFTVQSKGMYDVHNCLALNATCQSGFFQDKVPENASGQYTKLKGRQVCIRCHDLCLECTGYGFNNVVCQGCTEIGCVCPSGTYLMDNQVCEQCSDGCNECKEVNDCVGCIEDYKRVYNEMVPSVLGTYECVESCPDDQPYTLSNELYQNYCSPLNYTKIEDAHDNGFEYTYEYLVILLVIILVSLISYFVLKNQIKLYTSLIKINQFLEECEENYLRTKMLPNRKKLLKVEESRLKKVEVLETGDFSTVYKGILITGKSKAQVPVAIRVFNQLNKDTFTIEFHKEAKFMGSLKHPHLLWFLAVSLTSKVTMVTQFMPLGNILDYLQKYKGEVRQETLMSWITQIAMGMAYLENNGLVHGSLTAKKVMIQSLNRVKVSYYGEETFMDKLFTTSKEKNNFLWMALESLKQDIFTHKSDVWSFGIVIWEILTYGLEPYGGASLTELLRSLEAGGRLGQPESCSAIMYSVMANCWTEDPTCRLSFQELVDSLTAMIRYPTHLIFVTENEDIITSAEPLSQDHYCKENYTEESVVAESTRDYENVSVNTSLREERVPTLLENPHPSHRVFDPVHILASQTCAEIQPSNHGYMNEPTNAKGEN